jgi:hypothetical protein
MLHIAEGHQSLSEFSSISTSAMRFYEVGTMLTSLNIIIIIIIDKTALFEP